MRYSQEQKQVTREKILEAAHRGFRRQGFSGLGVDGLAKDAGVTSGAFYKHFKSKDDAFQESVARGVGEFQSAVEMFQEKYGESWLDEFARFYLGEKRCAKLGDSCGLQSLTPEVTRSGEKIRSTYQTALLKAAESFTNGPLDSTHDRVPPTVWADIALLIGGVTLARAVQDPALADEIADAVHNAILR
ncbi:MAG: TetR/AcrR family transcriptional regulator [Candidatus Thiodiazotropha sp. L084R]